MTIHKGSRTQESGPVKTALLWIGGLFIVMAIAAPFVGAAPLTDALITFAVGAFLVWIGRQIPDKNVVKW